MSRLPYLKPDDLTESQRELFDTITGSKRRAAASPEGFLTPEGGLRGPFNAWLYAPRLGNLAQRLGECLRFEGGLSARQREIAVLCVSARWRVKYEWWAHARIAGECGVSDQVIEAIRTRQQPQLEDLAEAAVHAFSRAVIDDMHVPDAIYGFTADAIGDDALVELVILLGYYTLVSMTLNTFEVPVPQGEASPFPE